MKTAVLQHIGIGIDTARYGHRVTFKKDRHQNIKPLTVTEDRKGYQKLEDALRELHKEHPEAELHVRIDAAGQYAANLEQFLRSLSVPLRISIGDPLRNKNYHKSMSPKRSSDDTESQAMARFALVEQPPPTAAVPEEFALLREIAGRLRSQVKARTRAINQFHNLLSRVFPELAVLVRDLSVGWVRTLLKKYPTPQKIAAARLDSLKAIPYLKPALAEEIHAAARESVGSLKGPMAESLLQQEVERLQQSVDNVKALEKLLQQAYAALPRSGHVQVVTIPGIGPLTAAVLVSKIVSLDRFATPENLVGYFGVFPEEETSGVDRQGRPIPPGSMRMSFKGCDLARGYLWNAALSAIQQNAAVRELYERLVARGTPPSAALGHCMRKLLHQVYGVWASDRPFDEDRARATRSRRQPDAAVVEDSTVVEEDSTPQTPAEEQETETAAGHKRDVLPNRKVVTAAASRLEPVISLPSKAGGSIDFRFVREQVTFEQVLSRLGVLDQLQGKTRRRGICPLCRHRGRTFSVDLEKNLFRCFQPNCSQGNLLDFWATCHGLPLHAAAQHLARTFGLPTQRPPTQH